MQGMKQLTTLGFPILQAVAFSSDIYKFIHPAYGDLHNIFEVFALGSVTGSQGLLGEVSNDSTSAPHFAPGSTASPPTGASTRCALLADVLQSSGTSRESNHRNPLDSAKSTGSSPIPTPFWTVRSVCRSVRRRATSKPNPFPWPL